jgi:hypothetical protein
MYGLDEHETAIDVEMEIRSAVADCRLEALAGLCSDEGMVGEAAIEAFREYGGTVEITTEKGFRMVSVAMPEDWEDE